MSTAIRQWRGFKAATRLGWQISSNWTQPLVFVLYSVLRPLSAAFILVVMYRVISGGGANTAAVQSVQADCGANIEMRQIKYLNNIVEQDHRPSSASYGR